MQTQESVWRREETFRRTFKSLNIEDLLIIDEKFYTVQKTLVFISAGQTK